MVRLEVIEMAEPREEALSSLMLYASVSDEGQKPVLADCLRRAFDLVQRYADRALLAGRWRVSAEDHPGCARVYMGGKVDSVTDGHGSAVSFSQRGGKVYVGTDGYFEVAFSTEVNEADYAALLPVVLRYATALYDGKDTRELNSILKEALI